MGSYHKSYIQRHYFNTSKNYDWLFRSVDGVSPQPTIGDALHELTDIHATVI